MANAHSMVFLNLQQAWMRMGVWFSKMVAQGWVNVYILFFVDESLLAVQRRRRLFFIAFTTKEVFILWFFALLKYTPCHILDSFISCMNFLESFVVNFNGTIDCHNFFIPIRWRYLLHRHHTSLTAVNSARRNTPLQIQIFHVLGANMMGYPFALRTLSTINGILF